LDDCLVGPVPVGVNSFDFEGVPPDPAKIPTEDVLGVAALILTGSYNDQEFVRVGYYQNTEYDNEEMKESPPQKIVFERLVREMNTKPRVTRFQIKWSVISLFFCVRANARLGTCLHPHRVLLPRVLLHPLQYPRQTTWTSQRKTPIRIQPPKQTASHNHVVPIADLLITLIPLSCYMFLTRRNLDIQVTDS